jgi:hypothetical protein
MVMECVEVGPVALVLVAMPPEISGIQVQVAMLVVAHLKLPLSVHRVGSLRLFMSAGTAMGSP